LTARLRSYGPTTRELRRVLLEDLSEAVAVLAGSDVPGDERLHDLRKHLKRARATLRLMRVALGTARYGRENATLRDAARVLNGVRDAKVLVDTVDSLARDTRKRERLAVLRERAILLDHRQHLRAHLGRGERQIRELRKTLKAAELRVRRWRLASQARPLAVSGLKRIYRAGRRSRRAVERSKSVGNLHELRKQAKYLWHALEITGSGVDANLARCARAAHRLSVLLGDDHDLALLVARLERMPSSGGAHTLLRLARERREKLQVEALDLACRLYRRRPARFLAAIHVVQGHPKGMGIAGDGAARRACH
jgi:CHAD domain-containing protein